MTLKSGSPSAPGTVQLQFERANPERAKNELAVAVFCPVAPLAAGHAERRSSMYNSIKASGQPHRTNGPDT